MFLGWCIMMNQAYNGQTDHTMYMYLHDVFQAHIHHYMPSHQHTSLLQKKIFFQNDNWEIIDSSREHKKAAIENIMAGLKFLLHKQRTV